MSWRSLLNTVHAFLVRDMDAEGRAELDRQLGLPFDHELTPLQRRAEEARRMQVARGISMREQQGLLATVQRGRVQNPGSRGAMTPGV